MLVYGWHGYEFDDDVMTCFGWLEHVFLGEVEGALALYHLHCGGAWV